MDDRIKLNNMSNTAIFLRLRKVISLGRVVNNVYIACKGQIYMSSLRAGEQEKVDSYCISRSYLKIVYSFLKRLVFGLSFKHVCIPETSFNEWLVLYFQIQNYFFYSE